MSNPIDEYFTAKKEAGWLSGVGKGMKDVGKGFSEMLSPKNIGITAGATMLATGLDLPGRIAEKAYYAVTKNRDFNAMMDTNPDLKQLQRDNVKQFNSHYSSLRAINPQFASDPVVAGTYMRQMSLQPEVAGKVIVESLGGLPREQPGTRATQLLGMADPMEKMRALQEQKLTAEIAGMPGRTEREQQMHGAKMLELGQKAELHPGQLEVQKGQLQKMPFDIETAKEKMLAAQNKAHNQPKSWRE